MIWEAAAAVIGTMCAIASLKLKLNVIGIIAACENMISEMHFTPEILLLQ